jgi:hypothetical protein
VLPGYAGPHDLDLAVTGVPADAFKVCKVKRVSALKGVTHDAPLQGGRARVFMGMWLFCDELICGFDRP